MNTTKASLQKRLEDISTYNLNTWKIKVGGLLPDLLRSIDKCYECVTHESPDLREASIHILAVHWNLGRDERFRSMLLNVIRHDNSLRVVEMAIAMLGISHRHPPQSPYVHFHWMSEIAKIVTDKERAERTRWIAYTTILQISGQKRLLDAFITQRIIDWNFVEDCINEREASEAFPPQVAIPQSLSPRELVFVTRLAPELISLIEQRHTQKAIARATELLRKHSVWELYSVRASLYLGEKEFLLAIEDASRAIEINRTSYEAFFTRGQAYRCLQYMDKALVDMKEYSNLTTVISKSDDSMDVE